MTQIFKPAESNDNIFLSGRWIPNINAANGNHIVIATGLEHWYSFLLQIETVQNGTGYQHALVAYAGPDGSEDFDVIRSNNSNFLAAIEFLQWQDGTVAIIAEAEAGMLNSMAVSLHVGGASSIDDLVMPHLQPVATDFVIARAVL